MSTVIVYGPNDRRRKQLLDGVIKLEILAAHTVLDPWDGVSLIPENTIAVTSVFPDQDICSQCDALLVDSTAAEIKLAESSYVDALASAELQDLAAKPLFNS